MAGESVDRIPDDCGWRDSKGTRRAKPIKLGGSHGCCRVCDDDRERRRVNRARYLAKPGVRERDNARNRTPARRARRRELAKKRRQSLTPEQKAERLTRRRERNADPEYQRVARELYERKRCDPEHRATRMFIGSRRRAKKAGMPFALSKDWVEERLRRGRCERSGIEFDMAGELAIKLRSPYAPSLDRIDSNKGYTPDNVQVVVWAYNSAKGTGTDADVLRLARAIVAKADGLPLFAPSPWKDT